MNRASIRAAAKVELADIGWADAQLNRAVDEVTADIARILPRELTEEYTVIYAVTDETWTSAAAHGTEVALANKPVEPGSEVVQNSALTVTYSRDTDYNHLYWRYAYKYCL